MSHQAALTVDMQHMVEQQCFGSNNIHKLKFPQGMMGFFEVGSKGIVIKSSTFANLEAPASDKYTTFWVHKMMCKAYLRLFKTSQLDLCFSNISDIYVGPSLLRTNNVFFQASPTKNTYLTFTFASTGVVGVGLFQRRLLGVLSMSEIKLKQKT